MQHRARPTGLFLLAAAMGGIVACRQIVGIGDEPPKHLTSSACGLPYGTSACASCVNASCCKESTACAASNDGCAPYEQCLGACDGDAECRSQCTVDHLGATAPEVSELNACLVSHCADTCGVACGALATYVSMPPAAGACADCLSTKSCDVALACGSSADCQSYLQCLLACPTGDCQTACANAHANGQALFAQFASSGYSGACSTQCEYGNYWACVGQVDWPQAQPGTVTVTTLVVDALTTTMAYAGVDVAICKSCPCSEGTGAFYGHAPTDANGIATLQFEQPLDGARRGVNGCAQVTSLQGGIQLLPTFAYWGYPLSQKVGAAPSPLTRVGAFTPAEVQQGLSLLQVQQDPAKGYLGVEVIDCLGSPASGVVVTTSADPLVHFYGSGNLSLQSTDLTGTVAFANVPAGTLVLTATPLKLQKASSVARVTIQAESVTEVQMWPTP